MSGVKHKVYPLLDLTLMEALVRMGFSNWELVEIFKVRYTDIVNDHQVELREWRKDLKEKLFQERVKLHGLIIPPKSYRRPGGCKVALEVNQVYMQDLFRAGFTYLEVSRLLDVSHDLLQIRYPHLHERSARVVQKELRWAKAKDLGYIV